MTERRVISTDKAPPAIGPYSQAIVANGVVYCSGQIGMTPDGELVEGGVEAETRQAMTNLGAVLDAAGSSFEQVVQCSLFLADMNDFARVNEIYASFFGEAPPARACVEAARLPRDARFEIVATAVL